MKLYYFVLVLLVPMKIFSQNNQKITSSLSFQVNKTLYDRTITNNASGFGFGLQTYIDTKTRIKPLLEINGDLFVGTKEFYTINDKPVYSKSEVLGVYLGPLFYLTETLFISATVGTSLYNNKAHLGMRPSVGIYPSTNKRWTAKVSFTNIIQQDDTGNESFGYGSFALAMKLF